MRTPARTAAESPAPPVEETPADPTATAAAESRTGPRSPIVRFGQNFDYTWPSRAVTAFKKDWQGRVKAEVAEAAQAKGVLVEPLDETAKSK